ncbi:DUF3990 domain-containing protein, partial [Clostridioides difficile]|uniref:DUF3990 domain-containing protein n=1 Tax=Clostridioides difficile TaxID=1496 RepID=UPI001F2ED7D8
DSLDFGKGFYVTSIKTQAINWTERFKKRGKKAYLNSYSLDIDFKKSNLTVKRTLQRTYFIDKTGNRELKVLEQEPKTSNSY